MSKHTSLRVGGLTDFFVIAKTMSYLEDLYKYAKDIDLPIFILGSGTNILVGDKGIRGLVIKNEVFGTRVLKKVIYNAGIADKARRKEDAGKGDFLISKDLEYFEDVNEWITVEVLSGTPLSVLINNTLSQQICGLEWFSGIPGTVGGAIWNNIHGADQFIGNYVKDVSFLNLSLKVKTLPNKELGFGYNKSLFQNNQNLILSANLVLPLGNFKKAGEVAKEWAKRKVIQPKNSAGCTFSNLSENERERLGLENCGAGYIIDKILNLRGFSVGKAKVSEAHANFIETGLGAKAKDVLRVVEHINNNCYQKLGIKLKEEIVRVGEF